MSNSSRQNLNRNLHKASHLSNKWKTVLHILLQNYIKIQILSWKFSNVVFYEFSNNVNDEAAKFLVTEKPWHLP